MRLIDADALLSELNNLEVSCKNKYVKQGIDDGLHYYMPRILENEPTIDAVPVVRCKDCVFFHKSHVKCNDGTEKDFSDFPPEAFDTLGLYVTGEYGINVGSKCEIDVNNGYSVDKSVLGRKMIFVQGESARRKKALVTIV